MSQIVRHVDLEDKYKLDSGHVFITGTQALVRLPLMQSRLDKKNGLKTAGFISGYRGSPLGGFDQALWKARQYLSDHDIRFQPGINEDLGATAVWGSQQVHLSPQATVEGVFAMWYGKGPGVDRTGDVLKHANFAGSSKFGGVLALAGDDHACKSSTLPHQSEYAFMDAFIPVIHPATVQDVLDLGLYGWALSRYAGVWVGFKMLSDTVDTAASVAVDLDRFQIKLPEDFEMPVGGLNLRWPDAPLELERRMHDYKMKAISAFVRANALDRPIWKSKPARIGLIAVGKGYIELRQALADLGIDENKATALGINLYKVVVSWPLESEGIREFCRGLEQVIVVEEKRPLIENQLKEILYSLAPEQRPTILGKFDQDQQPLLPSTYELTSQKIAAALARLWQNVHGFEALRSIFKQVIEEETQKTAAEAKLLRLPYYCSGCPHNTSTTQLPEGSRALAGIGCHYMATWIDHRTTTFTQMGGEGVPWIGIAPFTQEKHIFANLGDGTYFHSGLLAIRAAVAANVNITYKILYNDAVAMTGGQPVDGPLTVGDITYQLHAERVRRIAIVTDEPEKYPRTAQFAPGVTIHHRRDLPQVQEELKSTPGTTALIYDQTCAAEKRRRRKRGLLVDPNRRIFINEAVCEGCGDCSKKSNCLSVVPLETEWGRKRAIDQSSCNKDFSCVNGFCPSFVSVIDGKVRRPDAAKAPEELFAQLPLPPEVSLRDQPYSIFITGVGGTGVTTIGALLGMAAHLEGKGCSVVDMAGLAQKGGAVVSHLRIATRPEDIHATRVANNHADLILGFDLVVTASPEGIQKINASHTHLIVNTYQSITGHFTKNPDYVFPQSSMESDILQRAGQDYVSFINAQEIATNLMGDSIMTNLFMVGYALQKGLLPLSPDAIEEAIALNGVAVEDNKRALNWGRLAAVDPKKVQEFAHRDHPIDTDHQLSETTDEIISRRERFLEDYQDKAYAARYRRTLERVKQSEARLGTDQLTRIIAQSLYRLMAYKDEYEVARLYSNGDFLRRLRQQFDDKAKLVFHLAPPLLARRNAQGELQKMTFGSWMMTAFKILAKLRFLRGTALDVFGYTAERRLERQWISDYQAALERVLEKVTPETLAQACALMELPQKIRGYGHVKERNHQLIKPQWDQALQDW
ncbi:indolepyruvate ferredoxin oxidoreductase family protein [Candidatus Odyssella thessalonicensis]|uniref:indolepyruvate ferredoxin oxidoreductase family protein n=1 Tax=Candidatus Odyssella thessalonicensis TaxID=84647 RepID=UPI000225A93C|nr:indolepyruvate ferredoxin oxidoreductase family protein [Candidatus Odyssella thessalonicensis]